MYSLFYVCQEAIIEDMKTVKFKTKDVEGLDKLLASTNGSSGIYQINMNGSLVIIKISIEKRQVTATYAGEMNDIDLIINSYDDIKAV